MTFNTDFLSFYVYFDIQYLFFLFLEVTVGDTVSDH